ncbi:MAG: Rrf2 family transcriptional regulator [Spirochaetota bacterium]|nr:Rrf2 family transcriptional regulator [Spirochaetota bacterium]
MMKISTKGRYGLRLMLDLALYINEGPIFLKDIAKRQDISEKYLGHLIPPLKVANLINSSRGAHGGYMLNKSPSEITLGEVIRALEGNHCISECVITPEICSRSSICITRDIWSEVSEKMMDVMESITLQNMLQRHKEKLKSQPIMYNI